MADDVKDEGGKPAVPPKAAVKSATAFVAKHGKGSRAVVEPVGRAGARVVLVGADDGALGDVVLPDVATAEALVEQVADLEPAEWDRDTTAALRIGPAHRHKMAGR
ncbi:MAG: hypothetical protein ABWY11_06925 [Umezawaea sp.]